MMAEGGQRRQRTWISVCPDEDEEEKSRWRVLLTDCSLPVSEGIKKRLGGWVGAVTFDGWISHVQ